MFSIMLPSASSESALSRNQLIYFYPKNGSDMVNAYILRQIESIVFPLLFLAA